MNVLLETSKLTRIVQSHLGFEPFNYDLCIDWAIELIENGIVSDNILMLASICKPTNLWEARSYVTNVLQEFDLEEYYGEKAVQSFSYYYVKRILEDEGNLLSNIEQLCYLCIRNDYDEGIYPFYLLKYSWEDLQDLGTSYHYGNVNLSNFSEVSKKEALLWIDNFEKGIFKNFERNL